MTLKEASPISAMLAAESTCESCRRMRPNCSFSWGELKNRPENLPRLTSRQVLLCRTGLQGWHHWIFVFHHKMAKTKISHTCSLSLGTARKLAWLGNPWGETGMRNLCACLLHLRPFKHLSTRGYQVKHCWSRGLLGCKASCQLLAQLHRAPTPHFCALWLSRGQPWLWRYMT